MIDATTKRLLQLLGQNHPAELRCAAALVLGEVGGKDSTVAQAICAALDDADPSFRLQALKAVGKLRVEAALPKLLTKIGEGGAESEAAADSAAQLGAKGTRGLQELMGHTTPGLRRRIASALAAAGTASAETAAVESLLDSDPGVVDAAARSLIETIPSLSAEHRRSLTEQVVDLLKPKRGSTLSRVAEAALIRLLARLGDPRGEAAFWVRLDGGSPLELRMAALNALGTLPPPSQPDKVKRLLACAVDKDFRVAAPALMILKGVAVNNKMLSEWLTLLEAPDPSARHFAIEKLGDKDSPDVAAALVRQLTHPDASLRKEALASLAKLEAGRAALVESLLEAKTPDEAWTLARAQIPFVKEYSATLRRDLYGKASEYLDANDRRADAFLTLLREADPRWLRDQLEDDALCLRKKKKYTEALVYLRLLTRDPACGETLRFENAASLLKVSSHDLSADSRASDHSLHQFAGLIHRHETDPIEYIEKAKWLEPEDLFYLGFHFSEGKGPEQEFGGKVLRLLVKRSPKTKLAKDARSKLRSAGLEK